MHKAQQKLRVKRKAKINSLQAAICNVALFKSMKDKDFRDSIFISYCQDGVILEAVNQAEWKRAHEYIEGFLKNKKIELLIDGYDKDQYQALINKGLKQITRKLRQRDEECPYINIIHYQKLRKSCEYMDKQRYADPLKDWQKKNKKNPNFAFLIVQPKIKFDEVKKGLLQFLFNQPVNFEQVAVEPLYFMYLLFYSPLKQKIRSNYNKKQMQICIQRQQQETAIKITNFTNININEFGYSIVNGQNNITKSGVGLQVIPASQLKSQIKNAKLYCKDNPTQLIQSAVEYIESQYGQNFIMVPYRQQEQQKYRGLIQKYSNTKFTKEQIDRKLEAHQICQAQDIEVLGEMIGSKNYKTYRVLINNCPFMIHEYAASRMDMDTFMIYLDQLQLFYCTYMVRYYGLAVKYSRPLDNSNPQQPQSYMLVFDYHQSTLLDMMENDMIIDSMQVATMVLQILYLIDFLHSHQQPRCLGPICSSQIFWPMAIVLPYLGLTSQEPLYSIQNDIKEVGVIMREMLGEEVDEDFIGLIKQMTNQNKYDRPTVRKCITQLEELLCL